MGLPQGEGGDSVTGQLWLALTWGMEGDQAPLLQGMLCPGVTAWYVIICGMAEDQGQSLMMEDERCERVASGRFWGREN